jgi:hypothetical protein
MRTPFPRRAWLHCLLLCTVLLVTGCASTRMQTVQLSPDKTGFVLHPSGQRYIPWGHNYGSVDIMQRLRTDPARVQRDFADMKSYGTTVARVHPEMPAFFLAPNKIDPHAIEQLKLLLKIAENSDIHLMVTGLACYKIKDRMPWYDALDDQARWNTQELFWSDIAKACAGSPAVFSYDLVNEPAAVGKHSDGWYAGRMGDVEFCQRLTLDNPKASGDAIFRDWTRRMVAAIRSEDPHHLITLGMLPFGGPYYKAAAEQLDFVSPHLYPTSHKVDAEIALLKQYNIGKPIVIGETFPLSCGVDDERDFLLKSRGLSQGWIGHWPDESPAQLAELKKENKLTIPQAIWLSWTDLFKEMGPTMTNQTNQEK